MQAAIDKNAAAGEWDETLCVGELIFARHGGYHILTAIEYRDTLVTNVPIFSYVTVIKADGQRISKPGTAKRCDASFCRRVTLRDIEEGFAQEIGAAKIKRDNLLSFIAP